MLEQGEVVFLVSEFAEEIVIAEGVAIRGKSPDGKGEPALPKAFPS